MVSSGCQTVSQLVPSNSPSQDYTHPDDHTIIHRQKFGTFEPANAKSCGNFSLEANAKRMKKMYGIFLEELANVKMCMPETIDWSMEKHIEHE